MSKLSRKGSPERFKELVEQKIEDLSSCTKTNQEEVEGSTVEGASREDEVKQGFTDRGYDVEDETVKRMIADTAEYLSNAPDDYTIDDWFDDTKKNYPDMLDPDKYDEVQSSCNIVNSGMATVTDEPETVEAAEEEIYPDPDQLVDWLSDHDIAYMDALDRFGVEDLSEVSVEGLVDYIKEHDDLYQEYQEDFELIPEDDSNEYGEEVNEEYVTELEGDLQYKEIPGLSPVVEDVSIDDDGETIFIEVSFTDDEGEISINDYEIPWEDLSGTKEDDIDYITDEIDADLQELEGYDGFEE